MADEADKLTRAQRQVDQHVSPSRHPADVASERYLASLKDSPEVGEFIATAGVATGVQSMVPKGGRKTQGLTTLIRSAARHEALRFMPSIRAMLDDPKVGWKLKLQAMEILLKYGVGVRDPASEAMKSAIQRGGVLILPPQATEVPPPLESAEPAQVVATQPVSGGLKLPPLTPAGGA